MTENVGDPQRSPDGELGMTGGPVMPSAARRVGHLHWMTGGHPHRAPEYARIHFAAHSSHENPRNTEENQEQTTWRSRHD